MLPMGYMLWAAFAFVVHVGAAPAMMRTKQTRAVAVSTNGRMEKVSNHDSAPNALMRNKFVSSKAAPAVAAPEANALSTRQALAPDIASEVETNEGEGEATYSSIEEWLQKFLKDDCLSVTTALKEDEAEYLRNYEHICPTMLDALRDCLAGCPTMSFECVYNRSCELADSTRVQSLQVEAQKVCDKMTGVAVEAALAAEAGDASFHAWKETKGGKGAYYQCFPPGPVTSTTTTTPAPTSDPTASPTQAPTSAPTTASTPSPPTTDSLLQRVSARAASNAVNNKNARQMDDCLGSKEEP